MSERVVPHSPSVESAVLGACLSEGLGWWKKVRTLASGTSPVDLFYVPQNKMVARAIERSVDMGDEITDASVADHLSRIGGDRLPADPDSIIIGLQTLAAVSTLEDLQKSVAILVQNRSARSMLRDAEDIVEAIMEDDLPPQEISKRMQKAAMSNLAAKEVRAMAEFMDELADVNRKPPFQIPTGISELDKCLGGGIEGGRNYVIAARPKIGKTTMLMNIVSSMLFEEQPPVIIFVSLETLHRDFMYKMLSSMGQLNQSASKDVVYGNKTPEQAFTDPEDLEEYNSCMEVLRRSDLYPIFPADIPGGMQSFMSVVMSVIARHPNRNIIIGMDYIQLFVQNKSNELAELSQFTRDVKLLSMEEEVAVIYLSQLNREGAHGEMPSPSNLRGSGTIEQDVDAAILLNRKNHYDATEPAHIMDVEVALNRVGSNGSFQVNWDGATNSIGDAEPNQWGSDRSGA